jgi:two-component system, NtrC family, sensor kinase
MRILPRHRPELLGWLAWVGKAVKRRSKAHGKASKSARRDSAPPKRRRTRPKAISNRRSATTAEQREIARLTRERDEVLEQQAATSDILKVISGSAFNLKAVLDTLTESAVRLCAADLGLIFQQDGDVLRLVANFGVSREAEQYWLQHPVPVGRGSTTARALLEGKAVRISDVLADPEYRSTRAQELAGYRSTLSLPLLGRGKTIGVFALGRTKPNPFTDKQVELLTIFADQAVIAVENSRLLNELRQRSAELSKALEQQTATSKVLQIISSSPGDLQPVFTSMIENAVQLCDATFGHISRWDGSILHLLAGYNTPPALSEFRKRSPIRHDSKSVTRQAVISKAVVHVADLTMEPGYVEGDPEAVAAAHASGARTMLAVPMLKDNEVIGAFGLARHEVLPFTDKQIGLVESFAKQAVIAIENARLLNELRQRTDDLTQSLEQQTATADVLGVISRSKFELQPILQSLVDTAARLCRAEQAVIFRLDGGLYHFSSGHAINPDYLDIEQRNPIALGQGTVVGRAAMNKRVVRIDDAWNDPLYEKKEDAKTGRVRSMIGVPLMREGEPIGVIALARGRVEPFADREIELVTTFADQAVIAIENVRLFEAVQQRTHELTESLKQQTATADVLKVISRSAFDLRTVLDTLLQSAARLCEADQGTITQRRGDEFYRSVSYGFPAAFAEYVRDRAVELGRDTATGRALVEGKIIHIPDVQIDPDYTWSEAQRLGGFRTLLGVPMLREGVPVGVLTLTRTEVQPFTDKEIELVSTFADQAAIAIENVRLFESVEARTRELAKSLNDLRAAQDRLVQTEKLASLGQLTAGIAHEIKNPLNFINNFSAVSVELVDELQEALGGAQLDGKLRADINEIADMLKGNLEKVVQHGKRADSIVKNMLLHSRQGSGEHQPVDINALVEESLNLAYHGARAEKQGFSIALQRSLDPTAGTVDLFPQEITRVLLNLISNGFYAAMQRKAENQSGDHEPMLLASTKNLGDSVEIKIRDNGTGIPPEVKEKMFNPFFTTKPAGEGTGLGLSLSHDIIVTQHAGSIEIDTRPGEFTEFRIVLPRVAAVIAKSGGPA